MRIIGGKYRGKKLWVPEGKDIRPTSDRVREAIFSILYSHLGGDYTNMCLADIFAGSGAFGLEALSRGMKNVTFVDIDTKCVVRNAKMFASEGDKISIIKANATELPISRCKFHMIFMDAPYQQGLTVQALTQIIEKEWLFPKALIIVEIQKNERFDIPSSLTLIDERVYGLARVLFLRFD